MQRGCARIVTIHKAGIKPHLSARTQNENYMPKEYVKDVTLNSTILPRVLLRNKNLIQIQIKCSSPSQKRTKTRK